jgi:exodeoxyribonuclease VII small subunit
MTKITQGGDGGSKSRSRTFESSLRELESTVRRLEEGNLTLDEATKLFESGMRLASRCNELLTSAELKITHLQSRFSDQMALVPDESDMYDEDAPSGS